MSKAEDSVVIRNIYHMMAYAFRSLDIDGYRKLSTEEFDNFADLMAAILAIGISRQRKRGLEREYSPVNEDLPTVRGRIDIRGSAKLVFSGRKSIACEYDEFGPDTYKNRILKTCAMSLLRRADIKAERSRDLKRSLIALQGIGELDPSRIEWSRLRYHRNSDDYPLLMNVCLIVIRGLLLNEEEGGAKLADFIDGQQLHALYEKFILEYFRKEHPNLSASAKVIDRGAGDDAPSFLPQLCTDITLHRGTRTLIIDAKCYGKILNNHYETEILSPANLNQILSYVVHEAHGYPDQDVQGMLLYALTSNDSEIDEAWQEVGHVFHVRTLDLGQEFSIISAQLDDIAELVIQGVDGCK